MIRSDSITWIAASLTAIALHGATVLMFASVLGERAVQRHSELRLDQAGSLAARRLGETSAPLVKAPASGASEKASTAENDAVVKERPEDETVAETSVPSQSAPAAQAQPSTVEAETPVAPEAGTESAVIEDGSDHAVIGESLSQAAAAGVAPPEASPGPANERPLPAAPAPDDVVSSEGADAPAEPAPSTSGVAPQADSAVVQSSATADVVTEAPNSAAAAEAQQPAAAALSASADAGAREAQDSAVLSETPDAAPVPPGASAQVSPDGASNEPVSVIPASPPDPGESEVAIQLANPPKPPKSVQASPPVPRDVLSAVRGFGSAPCFLAVPEQETNGQWRLRTYAGEQETLAAFDSHIRAAAGEVPNREKPLQQAQCAAADFASSVLQGAQPALSFSLTGNEFDSGGHVAGTITGIKQKWIYLVLIDDDGMMHDVTQYATVSGGAITLDIPVHVSGSGRNRTQLILAVASANPLSMLDLTEPRPLSEVLPLVRGQIRASKTQVDVAVQDFLVR